MTNNAIIQGGNDENWTLVQLQRAALLNSNHKFIGSGFRCTLADKLGAMHAGQGLTPIAAIENAQCQAAVARQGWG